MKVRKVISRELKDERDGDDGSVNVAGSINAVVAANVNEPGAQRTKVSSHQRIVQRNGRTEVVEERHSFDDESDQPPSKEESDD
jgi:hypothetical protein